MFKRKDWLFVHGREGPDSSSDSESEAEGEGSSSEEEDAGSEDQSLHSGDEDMGSDEDEVDADGGESPSGRLTVEEIREDWATEGKLQIKGLVLRCVPCQKLLVNPPAFKSHVNSKAHLSKLSRWPEGADHPIRLASEAPAKFEEDETHQERLARLRALTESLPTPSQDHAQSRASPQKQKQAEGNQTRKPPQGHHGHTGHGTKGKTEEEAGQKLGQKLRWAAGHKAKQKAKQGKDGPVVRAPEQEDALRQKLRTKAKKSKGEAEAWAEGKSEPQHGNKNNKVQMLGLQEKRGEQGLGEDSRKAGGQRGGENEDAVMEAWEHEGKEQGKRKKDKKGNKVVRELAPAKALGEAGHDQNQSSLERWKKRREKKKKQKPGKNTRLRLKAQGGVAKA